ncbi:MAG: efflux RND transporter periplasmic adaptor subunit [Pleurocapsa sp.]
MSKKFKKVSFLIGMGAGILLTWGFIRWLTPSAPQATETQSTNVTKSTTDARTVTVATVETTMLERTIQASGTVAAYEEVPVMSQATGLQITEILADRGDFVRQGQTLARLNNKMLQAEILQAQGAVAQFEARLAELRAGSRQEEITQAKARVNNAKSEVVKARSDLDLIQKRVKRNQELQTEGAITRDRLDEILNQEQVATSNLTGAKARLAEAEQALAQLQLGTRPETIRQAEAELTQARGRLQGIRTQLEDTTIVAPVDGTIATRTAQLGKISSVGESLFSIIENGRLELRLKVPETLIRQIATDTKVRITADSDRSKELLGTVREIEPIIDGDSRQGIVRVDLPSQTNFKPGMFLRAKIITDTTQGKTIPMEALLPQTGTQALAFVLQADNTVKSQSVKLGETIDEGRVEILQGLESSDRVVLKGVAYLKDGDRVTTSSEI